MVYYARFVAKIFSGKPMSTCSLIAHVFSVLVLYSRNRLFPTNPRLY